jgi:hypothetical protein
MSGSWSIAPVRGRRLTLTCGSSQTACTAERRW